MRNIATKTTGSSLTADEFNDIPTELENAITSTGITLSAADLTQLSQAISVYAAGGAFYTDSGSSTLYQLTPIGSKVAPPDYFTGMSVSFVPGSTNTTTTPSVNVAGLGVQSIVGEDGLPILVGDIRDDGITRLTYTGTAFALLKVAAESAQVYTSIGGGLVDESKALESFINSAKEGADLFITGETGRPLYINQNVQIIKNYVKLHFQAPLLIGPEGVIASPGSVGETGVTKQVDVDAPEGQTFVIVTSTTGFTVGQGVTIRGRRDPVSGNPLPGQKATFVIVGIPDGVTLDLSRGIDIPGGVESVYTNPEFEANFGEQNVGRVFLNISAALTADSFRDDVSVEISNTLAGQFNVGDTVFLTTTATSQDAYHNAPSNFQVREYAQISKIETAGSTTITLNHPLSHDLVTADEALISTIEGVRGVTYEGANIYWAVPSLNRAHGLELRFCLDSRVTNCTLYGLNGSSWNRHGVRLDSSYRCVVDNNVLESPAFRGGGDGYGTTVYGSTDCKIKDNYYNRTRHSVLLFNGSNDTQVMDNVSNDCRISDYDMHGGNCRDVLFRDNIGRYGESVPSVTQYEITGSSWSLGLATFTLDRQLVSQAITAGDTVRIAGTSFIAVGFAEYDEGTSIVTLHFPAGHYLNIGDTITVTSAENARYNIDSTLVVAIGTNFVTYAIAQQDIEDMGWLFSPACIASVDGGWDGEHICDSVPDDDTIILQIAVEPTITVVIGFSIAALDTLFSKAAYRVGNPTHITGDRHIRFLNNTAVGYRESSAGDNGYAYDVIPGADNVSVEGGLVQDCQYVTNPQQNVKSFAVSFTATAGSWLADVATLTIGTHTIAVGEYVTVTGMDPVGYDVSIVRVDAITATTIDYALTPDPGAFVSGGGVTEVHPYLELQVSDVVFKNIDVDTNADDNDHQITLDGQSTLAPQYDFQFIKDITIKDNLFKGVGAGIEVTYVDDILIQRNTYIESSVLGSTTYGAQVGFLSGARVIDNDFSGRDRGILLADTDGAVVTDNAMRDLADNILLISSGANTNVTFLRNPDDGNANPQIQTPTSGLVSRIGGYAPKGIAANYPVVQEDIHVQLIASAAGNITVTLPDMDTLTDGFSTRLVNTTANDVVFATSGGDTLLSQSSFTTMTGAGGLVEISKIDDNNVAISGDLVS